MNIIFFQDWFKASIVLDSFWGDVRSIAVKSKPFVLGRCGDFGLLVAMTETYQS